VEAKDGVTAYDVIVVGGRIAGSATAMMLARAGARVLMLERNTFPSAPVSVPVVFANALAILDRLGVREAIEARAAKMYMGGAQFGAVELLAPVQPFAGYNYHLGLRREVLDQILIDHAAREPNVEVRTGWTVTGLIRAEDRVLGVRARGGGGPEGELWADLVVGADGAHSVVAREVQPREYRRRRGQNAVYYAYYRNFKRCGEPMTFSYRGEGYAVLRFDADDGLTAISLGVRPEDWPDLKRDPVGEFERRWRSIPQLAELGRHAERITPVKGHGPRGSYYRKPYGSGWALVGDAAYLKDPCTGQGIYDALHAAELVTEGWQAWKRGEAWERAMRRYQRTRDRETRAMYELTYQSSKIPKRAELNPIEWMLFSMLSRDREFVSELAGIYNGASAVDQYVGPRGGFNFMARLALKPLALRWATGTLRHQPR
jgi:flavin-dependent dehydrogenase